jgi:hypothetical protein
MMMDDLTSLGMPGMMEEEPLDELPLELEEVLFGDMTPEKITTLVDQLESDRGLLHARMDEDIQRYFLTPFQGIADANGKNVLADRRKFTSNDPATTMDLALYMCSTAKRLIRVNQPRPQEESRQNNNLKELLCLGLLEAADARRVARGERRIQDGEMSQSLFRGRICQRALMINDLMTGKSRPDVTDWDPRNVYYEYDQDGMKWACLKDYKSRSAIINEFGIDPRQSEFERMDNDQDESYSVYDYYDRSINVVIVEGNKELKRVTLHGMPRCPVVFDMAETKAMFSSGLGSNDEYESHYGESFYRSSRDMFDEQNFVFSIVSTLVERSIAQPIAITSRDGSLTLEDDPWETGQQVSLSTDEQQAIMPLEQMQMAREAGAYMGVITAMMQRGTFPANLFGQLSTQLSGYALSQLRRGAEAPIMPHVASAERATKMVLELLVDAYKSGLFGQMEVEGHMQDPRHSFFYERIPPEAVAGPGTIEVKYVPDLPQDDAGKVQMVQILREGPGGVPLIDDRYARELMQFQDVDQIESAVWEQQAARGSPLALAMNSMKAAIEQGNQQLFSVWQEEANKIVMKDRLQLLQMMMMMQGAGGGMPGAEGMTGPSVPGNNGADQSRTTVSSQVQPPQARGENAAPTQQAGPNVPPGTPRPGATTEQRLANAGLYGPRG